MEKPKDIPMGEAIALVQACLNRGAKTQFFVKWTCPKCGKRAVANNANEFHSSYQHEDCGGIYGPADPVESLMIGLMMVHEFPSSKESN